MPVKKSARLTISIILTAVVLFFVYRQLQSSWGEISTHDWSIDLTLPMLSILPALGALFIFSTCWKLIISSFGRSVGFFSSFRISYLSNLGRYIPGKIWQVFGILYLARKKGVTAEEAGASFGIIQLFAIPSSILVFVICARLEPAILSDQIGLIGTGSATALMLGMVVFCLALVFYPAPLVSVANRILSKLGRPTAEFKLDKKVALKLFVGYACGWILFGLAFWMFVRGVAGPTAPGPIAAIGLYNAAYQIGYLALFAPGGLGPRELVMGALLTPFLGPVAAAVAVLARVWSIVVDSIAAGIALGVKD